MRSEVSICNQALALCGEKPIVSFDDGTDASNLCLYFYAELRDSLLEESIWSFATKRAELPLLSGEPSGYGSQFQLPKDCLRVDKVFSDANFSEKDQLDYIVEGRKILTDNAKCYIRYTMRLEDITMFSPNFTQALVYSLATEFAIPLTKSRTLQQQFYGIYTKRVEAAEATDSMQSPTRQIEVPLMSNTRR